MAGDSWGGMLMEAAVVCLALVAQPNCMLPNRGVVAQSQYGIVNCHNMLSDMALPDQCKLYLDNELCRAGQENVLRSFLHR